MMIQPYLMFDGRCEEASQFYVKALGATVGMQMRVDESPEPPPPGMMPPGSEKKIMHMTMRIGESLIMMSDGPARGNPEFKGITLSLSVKGEEEADRVFAALADGGQVFMPIGKTFWSPRFGMLADRFGVAWMVNMEA